MAHAEVIVREAKPQDVLLVTEFVVAMARDSEGAVLDEKVVAAAVRAALQDRARGVYYVAEADEGLVGQALVTSEWSDWNCCEYWWLQSVYVLRLRTARVAPARRLRRYLPAHRAGGARRARCGPASLRAPRQRTRPAGLRAPGHE